MATKRIISNACAIGLCAGAAIAGGEPQDVVQIYGLDFALIGDPGNRAPRPEEVRGITTEYGSVDYEFWMSTMELSVEQYREFVEAYLPFYVKRVGRVTHTHFVGDTMDGSFREVIVWPEYSLNDPVNMGWEYAARYVNWLHHGKVIEEWAFETGVYDTSTFVQDDNEVWQHQAARSPGARFFMPTFSEWNKAGYWDPNRNNGEGSYWTFPNSSDTQPRPGLPEDGGERNAGERIVFPLDVGSYPEETSPWGMLDMAGGQSEVTETPTRPDRLFRRVIGGSYYGDEDVGDPLSHHQVVFGSTTSAFRGTFGLRLGVPSGFHPADLDEDDRVDFFDISLFVDRFINGDDCVDFRRDGVLDADDVWVFLGLMELEYGN